MRGFAAFRLLWLGQALALLGREMTWFALTLYAYQKTGQATTLSLLGFFHFLPLILLSPLAGALVDRYLMLLLFGSLGVLWGLSGYLLPKVREAESLLPDAKEDQAAA